MKLSIVALSVLILAASVPSAATEPARIDLSITAIDVVPDPLADYNVHVTPTVMTRIGEIVPGELLADIQVFINGIDFGSNVYRAKDFVEGLCWADQPPSCVPVRIVSRSVRLEIDRQLLPALFVDQTRDIAPQPSQERLSRRTLEHEATDLAELPTG